MRSFLALLIAVAVAGCSRTESNSSEPSSTTFLATNHVSQFDAPSGWVTTLTLHHSAEIQARDPESFGYAVVLQDNRGDFTSFEKFAAIAEKRFFKSKGISVDPERSMLTVNGKPCRQYHLEFAEPDGLLITMLYNVAQGEIGYYQILLWSTRTRFKENESAFRQILATFREHSENGGETRPNQLPAPPPASGTPAAGPPAASPP